ncbi:TRAP transporter small permease [Paracoccus aestuariivivens]|uniref:TRAP transporter small permease protein n=1 Tax=Paracoccus aestuariivivens TaxID=1820333 RepID=A0A6L6JA68_9RHOB|nr:TRAP transporter small permease [Paracoccus aestuariivivens]MTH79073.1 TRAP transporter small permease subunit [Paracoccus aestuariivivens]
MQSLRRGLDLVLGFVCCSLLAGLVLVLAWQVFSRYAMNAPSSYSEEVLRYGVIWMSLLGAAYATGKGSHMSVDLLRDRLSLRGRLRLDGLISVAFVLFAGIVLIWGGMRGVSIAHAQTSAVMRIPMSWVYLSLPVSGALMVLYSLLNLADLSQGRSHHADLEAQAEKMGE